jgi:AmpD protein
LVSSSASFALDADGRLPGVRWVASPNFDLRPDPAAIDLVVLHGISLPPGRFGGRGVEQLFTNTLDAAAHPYFESTAALRVSAHFYVRRSGEIVQFVACRDRAWHAGASTWRGRERCNDFSVGIELEGTDLHPYAGAQYRAGAKLVAAIRRRYPVTDIVGHSDIAPGRKTDPGAAFDWPRFRAALARHD